MNSAHVQVSCIVRRERPRHALRRGSRRPSTRRREPARTRRTEGREQQFSCSAVASGPAVTVPAISIAHGRQGGLRCSQKQAQCRAAQVAAAAAAAAAGGGSLLNLPCLFPLILGHHGAHGCRAGPKTWGCWRLTPKIPPAPRVAGCGATPPNDLKARCMLCSITMMPGARRHVAATR